MYTTSERLQKFIKISVFLLTSHSVEYIHSYKNLLRLKSDSDEITEIFIRAVKQVFETDLETIYWLLQHPESLKPEVNIRELVILILKQKILSLGFTEQDFALTDYNFLVLNPNIPETLLAKYHWDKFMFQLILNLLSHSIIDIVE